MFDLSVVSFRSVDIEVRRLGAGKEGLQKRVRADITKSPQWTSRSRGLFVKRLGVCRRAWHGAPVSRELAL